MNKNIPLFLLLCMLSLFILIIPLDIQAQPIVDEQKEMVISEKQQGRIPRVTSINFRDESLEAVTKSISKLTGKSFIVTTNLGGKKVTIISQEEVTIEEAYRAFLSALEMNGLTVVPVGKFLKIVDSRDAATKSIDTYTGKYAPTSDQYITRIYHLKYIKAEDIARSLSGITTPRSLVAYAPTNSLIITDTGANINRLLEIVENLDVKGFEEKLEIIKIKNASAKEVADQLNNFYREGGAAPFGQSRFGPPPSFGERGAGGGEVISKIIPDSRTNSIIVKANEEGIQKLKDLIARLDVPVGGGGKIHVYYLQNSAADKVSDTLNKIIGKGPPRPTFPGGPPSVGGEDFEGEIKITGDQETNSLVITASLRDFQTLTEVVKKLDIPRKQVYVEAYIFEVNITKNQELGVSYTAGVPAAGFKDGLVGGFAGTSPHSLDVILDPRLLMKAGSGVLGFVTQGSTDITLPDGTKKKIPNATALVRALATDADANLLSAPQLLALDNVQSEIEVSEKIPTVGATSVTATGLQQQTINREPIGLTLKIKPQINETSELVRLELEHVIEDISNQKPPTDIAGQTFASTKRSMKTTVLVKHDDTVIIGGLLRDNVNNTSSKVPLLGDIPILGWLFKSSAKNSVKTNLLLFLTPSIMKEYGDFRRVFDKKIKEREEFMDKHFTHKDDKATYLNRLNPPKQK